MNGVPIDETIVEDGPDEDVEVDNNNDDDGMEVDDEGDEAPEFFKEIQNSGVTAPKTKSRKKKTRVAELVREKIRRVLEDVTELADKRAGKCDENDFLRLLQAFNDEGIHFS
jgi:18S rRNA (adenine1779-N6/adenine1780-N6)-dimethyltransferase